MKGCPPQTESQSCTDTRQ